MHDRSGDRAVSLEQGLRHIEHRRLRFVRVGHDAPSEIGRGPRHVGDPLGDQAPRARLGGRHRQPPLRKHRTHDALHRVLVLAIDKRTESVSNIRYDSGDPCIGVLRIRRSSKGPQEIVREARAKPELDLPVARKIGELVFERRLSHTKGP